MEMKDVNSKTDENSKLFNSRQLSRVPTNTQRAALPTDVNKTKYTNDHGMASI